MNYFISADVAQRYAAARPNFHPLVVARIVDATGTSRFGHALDVGCGTGQSSRALADICETVEAIDVSREMIARASPHDRVRYHVAAAEYLPFLDCQFDLITVGLAFHWFDQPSFLREARRMLKIGAWLVIYNHGFKGEMEENPDFHAWFSAAYAKCFPTPQRGSLTPLPELAAVHGFEIVATEAIANDKSMSPQALAAYLATQTNVIAAVEASELSFEAAERWIAAEVTPFLIGQTGRMKFSGEIRCLRRLESRLSDRP